MSPAHALLEVSAVLPGAVLAEDLRDAQGHVLLSAGTVLRAAHLEALPRHGVTRVAIEASGLEAASPAGEGRPRLARLFRRCPPEDDWFRALIEAYRSEARP